MNVVILLSQGKSTKAGEPATYTAGSAGSIRRNPFKSRQIH